MLPVRALARLPHHLWVYARLASFNWLDEAAGLAACRYPRDERALHALAERGVGVLINLHVRPHAAEVLDRHGLREVHLPVPDFHPPTPEQLEAGLAAIEQAQAAGQRVAVHCGAGLGRTGTLLACYLVRRDGLAPEAAIARVRAARPGSIETPQQVAAIVAFARQATSPPGGPTEPT